MSMTIAFWCVLAAGILPMLWVAYAKLSIGFNNKRPRADLEKATGKAQRAKWAHDNSWEAFAPFAAAVLIASFVGVDDDRIDLLAMAFICCRVAYGFAYIFDKATIRSLVWFGGFLCVIGLYVSAALV